VSCKCDGWVLPWVNGSCTSVCGDSLVRGTETCDDGNVLDHDGCSSVCQTEACNVSCLCDGWTLPWVNGSCTPICGDGLLRGT
jgi:cysteine-rich repeat protein